MGWRVMDKNTAIEIYQWLDNHLGQREMDYVDWLADEKERLEETLLAASNELTDATAQINELNAENRRLLAELEAARARLEYNENKMRELNNELAKALGLTF